MKFLKKNLVTILLGLIFIAGLGMICYPTFANWWNSWNSFRIGEAYEKEIEAMSSEDLENFLSKAEVYNAELPDKANRFWPSNEENERYNDILDVSGSGVMGMVVIPSVKIELPIYHGTSEEVLAVGAGHLEGSSLPIGGAGTHTVITGHRGLPSAKLFTDLDQVVEGDYVILKVLNETLTYQIDSIRIVLPEEVESLNIDPEQDLCTLVTCTPYGVNTHRMLLTGHRVENLKEWTAVADAHQVDAKMVALFIAIPILILLFIVLMVRSRRPKGDPDEKA